uniref:Uncharacterized protein n=1 Tax=Spironucleus salmonicida TaxID=348837 RepID=V6LFJ9_9EUKA|eukprot:EST42481.1 Hypothetical protein SS50377_17787 [Spironucleus salmonicida]
MLLTVLLSSAKTVNKEDLAWCQSHCDQVCVFNKKSIYKCIQVNSIEAVNGICLALTVCFVIVLTLEQTFSLMQNLKKIKRLKQ